MAENKKHPTLDQLKILCERAKVDSVSRVSELASLVAQGLEDVEHSGVTVTLPVDQWTADGTQTVSHDSFLASNDYWYLVLGDTPVAMDDITASGQAIFRCDETPTEELTVYIIRLEVKTNEQL